MYTHSHAHTYMYARMCTYSHVHSCVHSHVHIHTYIVGNTKKHRQILLIGKCQFHFHDYL